MDLLVDAQSQIVESTASFMSAYLALQCPSCGGQTHFLPGSDRFTCEYCGNQQNFYLPAAQSQHFAGLCLSRPAAVAVSKNGSGLEFSWRWFTPKYWILAAVALVWNAILFLYLRADISLGGAPGILFWVPVIQVGVGIFLAYSVLAGFLNRTTIRVFSGRLVVRHDPVPWPTGLNVSADDLVQLFCEEKRRQVKHGGTFAYQLGLLLKDGRRIYLVSDLDSPEIARYLEQEIAGSLRIEDHSIIGELVA